MAGGINFKKTVMAPGSNSRSSDDKLARQRKQAEQTKRDASVAMGERVRPPNWDVSRSVTGKAAPAAPKPKARPAMPAKAVAPKPKARPAMPAKAAAPMPKAKPVTFRGNWVGAAPTEMQKRGGARIDRGGGILGALKRMRKPK